MVLLYFFIRYLCLHGFKSVDIEEMSIQTSDMDHLTMVSDDGVGVAMHSLVRS